MTENLLFPTIGSFPLGLELWLNFQLNLLPHFTCDSFPWVSQGRLACWWTQICLFLVCKKAALQLDRLTADPYLIEHEVLLVRFSFAF